MCASRRLAPGQLTATRSPEWPGLSGKLCQTSPGTIPACQLDMAATRLHRSSLCLPAALSLAFGLFGAVVILGCTEPTENAEPTGTGGSAGDGGLDGATACKGKASFFCAPQCGGDVIGPHPICVAGGWECPDNSVRNTDCPDDTCFTNPVYCCAPDGSKVGAKCPGQDRAVCPSGTALQYFYSQPCPAPPGCATSGCGAKEVCTFRDDSCGKSWPGACEARPTTCPTEGPPACGCDGVVYDNDCLAQQAGVDMGTGCTAPPGLLLCGTRYCKAGAEYCRVTVLAHAPMTYTSECVPIPTDCPNGANCACLSNQPCADNCANSQPMPKVTCFTN